MIETNTAAEAEAEVEAELGEFLQPSPPPTGHRDFMEMMDFDLDSSRTRSFDVATNFCSNHPQSTSFLSPSPPPTMVMASTLQFPTCLCNSETLGADHVLDDTMHRPLLSAIRKELSDNSSALKERLAQALRYVKDSSTDQHVLVQVWVPVRSGDRYVLTTSGQPFILDPQSARLLQYRTVSLTYLFSVDGDDDGDLGLPGRVFLTKMPEWTPNVQYYSSSEYPRLCHALNHNVQGSLALPVFESTRQSCVGVVELIMTSQKINYAREHDRVCKALEAVNLKSSEILEHPTLQIYNEGHQADCAEILEILTLVCETHKLPLAQTWIPCSHGTVLAEGGGKKSCSSFDGSCSGKVCMSTTDMAFYIVDAHMWGFRDACVEHHLQKGQGVAGRAFESGKPCFCRDITQFCKTEYPLVHYARMFELAGSLAICLESYLTGHDGYVLEFFLPPDCKKSSEQDTLLENIVTVIKQCFQKLKVVGSRELQGKMSSEVIEKLIHTSQDLESPDVYDQSCGTHRVAYEEIEASHFLYASRNNKHVTEKLLGHKLFEEDTEKNEKELAEANKNKFPNTVQGKKNTNKTGERRRGKPEKSISLDVLEQYFAGSLKDAAKSLGVCPTTMKRICRQHGISRWPSRKINKVKRSLSKLEKVIESVEGADGSFKLSSLVSSQQSQAADSNILVVNLDEDEQNVSGARHPDQLGDSWEYSLAQKALESDELANKISRQEEHICGRSSYQSSGGRLETSSPQCSSQASQASGNCVKGSPSLSMPELGANENSSSVFQLPGDLSLHSIQLTPNREASLHTPVGRKESVSSEDLRNLSTSAEEACQEGHALPFSSQAPEGPTQQMSVKIKASYKKDIFRFSLSRNAGIAALREEVAMRLKLEAGTFDIKYLDDDQEWVVLASEVDLEECIKILAASVKPMVRLLVSDVVSNHGNSC